VYNVYVEGIGSIEQELLHYDRLSQMEWELAKNGCQSLGVMDMRMVAPE
jgi:hypothetical protein